MKPVRTRRLMRISIALFVALLASLLSQVPASAHHDIDEEKGYYLKASLDAPTFTSGNWRAESSGGHDDEAWLRLASRKGYAEFNFGPLNIHQQRVECFVPARFSGRQVAYRIGDDNYSAPESIYTVPDGGGWLRIAIEYASTQYDFVVTALGVDSQGRSFPAAANACRIVGNYGNISGGTHVPWTPTGGGVEIKGEMLEFWWDPADDPGIWGHGVRLSDAVESQFLCVSAPEYPVVDPTPEAVEPNCDVEISTVLEAAGAASLADLKFDIYSTSFNGRYSAQSIPFVVGPVSEAPVEEQVTDLFAEQHGHGEVTIDWKVDGVHEQSIYGFEVEVAELPVGRGTKSVCTDLNPPVAGLVGTSCRLTDLDPGQAYQVTVTGQGSSSSINFRTPPLPARAVNAKASGEINEVRVSWDYIGGSATSYNVWLAQPGLPTCSSPTNVDGSPGRGSCVISGLESATTYEVHIYGEDIYGQRSGDVVLSVQTAIVEYPQPCDDDGAHTIEKNKAIRKANRQYRKAVTKLADKFEDRPKKLAKKIKQQKKKRTLRIARAEAVYRERCGP